MRVRKTKIAITLLCVVLFITGCGNINSGIDTDYWKTKLKEIAQADKTSEENYPSTEDSGKVTEKVFNALDILESDQNEIFERIGSFLLKQLKHWAMIEEESSASEKTEGMDPEPDLLATTLQKEAQEAPNGRVPVTLKRVVDGDTLIVVYDEVSIRVRLIGVNTAESVHSDENKNTPEGAAASDYLKELLQNTDTVWLEFDKDPQDDYGRSLAYVWLNESGTNIETDMLNGVILKSGHGEIMSIEPNTKYATELASIR